jgi:parvulin-like peptidyl-prolyl isomerase
MRVLLVILFTVALVACQEDEAAPDSPTLPAIVEDAGTVDEAPVESDSDAPAATPLVEPSPTPIPPTPTPMAPLAALVNGQPVFLADYENELARYEQGQAELGLSPGAEDDGYKALVLENLVEQELIRQAAADAGINVTTEMVDEQLDLLRQEAGGEESLGAWLEANQFSLEEFREAVATDMLVEQVKTTITADVPFAVPQVHARYLQVEDADLAASLREQVLGGADFATLAQQHSLDRQTAVAGGDLGWFPEGTLLVPSVEAAAFALAPGEVSEVIAVDNGAGSLTYYLLQLLEREEARALTPQQRAQLLQEAFETWLAAVRAGAEVERFVEAGT